MGKIKSRKRLIAITTAILLVAGGGTAAFAYWSSTGAGTGSATTGTSTAFVISTPTISGASALTPGGPAQVHSFTVTNPGTGSQYLSSVVVTVDPTFTKASTTGGPACTPADYTVSTSTFVAGQIAAGANVNGSVSVSLKNLNSNQDACKDAVVPLLIAAS